MTRSDPRFRNDDDALARVAAIGFAQIAIAASAWPMLVHAPVTRHGDMLRFHVARNHRAAADLDRATALLCVAPLEGYVSPNWYVVPGDQVPTWNYVTIEVEGVLRLLDEAELVEQLDELARIHESRVNPAAPWTRAKMNPVRFQAMLAGIRGFELVPTTIRSTAKLSQNKSAADRAGVIAGMQAAGNREMAAAMEDIAARQGSLPAPRG